jgi:threonine dehydrogenase-like Zn-dependent dehydrogenase
LKAARYYDVHDIRVEEIDIPEINDNEVLVKVKAAAICGTDLRILNYGHFKIPTGQGRILGHEMSGQVTQVGKNVKGFKAGDRVSVAPNVGCGVCEACKAGYNQLCPDYEAFGISLDGAFAEYMKVTEGAIKGGNMVHIPEELSYEEAAIAEPFSCVYNSWNRLGTKPGDSVLVIGSGPIGSLHVAMNKLAGATKIIAADLSDVRLEEIKAYGTDLVVNAGREDTVEFVKKVTNGLGVNVVITAGSHPDMQRQALEATAFHGRINYFGGMPKGKEIVELNTNKIHYKELTVLGTTGSSIKDYNAAINILASKKIDVSNLITGKFDISQIGEAFEYAASGKGMKTLIIFE